jgi:tRNA G18 (ribose-2'-O)-methylase SpoU
LATPEIIADPADPRLEPYLSIRERDLVGRQGRFVAEGEVVLRLLLARGRFGLESVLLSRRRAVGSPDLVAAVPDGVPLYVAEDAVIEAAAGFEVHRGVLAIGLRGEEPDAHALLASLPAQALVAVGVGLANHDNMGGLFRNAAAFGVSAVLLDETCCDPLYRKAIRVSVGAALTVPFARGGAAASLLAALEAGGFESYALSPSGAASLAAIRPPARAALVLGAEGPGLPPELMQKIATVRISMAPGFDSLNVATAAGVALHHFFENQRFPRENP